MTGFTCLLGGPAFSEFHTQKLIDELRRRAGHELLFSAQFIYFVESPQDLSQEEVERLEALLNAELIASPDSLSGERQSAPERSSGPFAAPASTTLSEVLLVVPRLGTQSPLSLIHI